MNPSLVRCHLCTAWVNVLSALLLASAISRLPAQSQPSPDVVSLPPLMVEEKGTRLVWRYLATPTQEIISVCDEGTMLAFAKRSHRLDELLEEIVPARFLAAKSGPDINVIFNETFGRARSREVVAEMLQRAGKGGITTGFPSPSGSGDLPGTAPQIRFLPNMRSSDLDSVSVFSIFQDSTDTASHFIFSDERIATLLQERVPRLPDWFISGTVGLFRRTEFGEDQLQVKAASWESTETTAALKKDPNHPRALLSMEELFTRRAPTAGGTPTEIERLWNAQAGLFLRWAVVENKGARRETLWKFVDRLEKEPLTETLFRECFGMGFSDARDRLSDYLPSAIDESIRLKAPKSVPLPRLQIRIATDGEIARLRGAWERMEIGYVREKFPAVVDRYIDQARTTLYRAYDRNDRDPRLLTELGLTEIEAGKSASAREFLEAAVRAQVARPSAYYQLAQLRFDALTAGKAKLTPAQSEEVLAPLLAGRRFEPPLLETYVLMSEVFRLSASPPTPAQLAPLNQGTRLFAHVAALVAKTAAFNVVAGQTATALELIDAGQRAASEPAVRERFQRIREELSASKQ